MGCYVAQATFDASQYDSVLSAINFALGKGVRIIVNHAAEAGGKAVLPLAFECSEDGILREDGCTFKQLESLFEGVELKTSKIKPSVRNKAALDLARELQSRSEKKPVKLSEIKPNPQAHDGNKDPFAGLVGLDDQIKFARDIAAAAKEYGREALNLNLVLKGGPGTGKTSFANAFSQHLRGEGVIDGPFLQVSAEDLVACYAGQTATLVREAWERAAGGCFFLDEAYRLEATASYGIEAINCLNELMERDRHETMVVVAGYPDPMERFLDSNPGLGDRFGCSLSFEDYTPEMLAEIFKRSCAMHGMNLQEGEGEAVLLDACRKLTASKTFANGRTARKLFERCLVKQASLGGGSITTRAIELAIGEEDLAPKWRPIGFSQA